MHICMHAFATKHTQAHSSQTCPLQLATSRRPSSRSLLQDWVETIRQLKEKPQLGAAEVSRGSINAVKWISRYFWAHPRLRIPNHPWRAALCWRTGAPAIYVYVAGQSNPIFAVISLVYSELRLLLLTPPSLPHSKHSYLALPELAPSPVCLEHPHPPPPWFF